MQLVANCRQTVGMNIEIVFAIATLIALAIVLVRAVSADGYGVRPGPRNSPEERTRWVMPHDEIRHR